MFGLPPSAGTGHVAASEIRAGPPRHNNCSRKIAVSTNLHIQDADPNRLIAGFRQTLDVTYARLLETAKQEWERHCSGNDPSDACVSVRVTSDDSRSLPVPALECFGNKVDRSCVADDAPCWGESDGWGRAAKEAVCW